jgi:hypothetical protein
VLAAGHQQRRVVAWEVAAHRTDEGGLTRHRWTRVSAAVHGVGVRACDRAECIATIHAALDVLVVVNNDADAALPLLPKVTSFIFQPVSINTIVDLSISGLAC